MKRIARIIFIVIAAAVFIFGAIMFRIEEKKAESIFYGATMVMSDEARAE